MNFKNWLLSEEIFPNKTATVYHRTRDIQSIERILHTGFKPGGGCTYGCGLYTTFDLKSQFSPNMQGYGSYIVKFKATNLDKYLITSLSVAKYILGKNYKISDQLKKLGPPILGGPSPVTKHPLPLRLMDSLEEYDKIQESSQYSSDLASKIYKDNKWIENLNGIIYNGRQDGYCLVKYEPVNDGIVMLGYTEASTSSDESSDENKYKDLLNNKGWITVAPAGKIKSLYSKGKETKTEFKVGDIVYISGDPSLGYRTQGVPVKITKINNDNTVGFETLENYYDPPLVGQTSLKYLNKADLSNIHRIKPPEPVPSKYKLFRTELEGELDKIMSSKRPANKLKLYLIRNDINEKDLDFILKRYPGFAVPTIETIVKYKPELLTPKILKLLRSSAFDTEKLLGIILNSKKTNR